MSDAANKWRDFFISFSGIDREWAEWIAAVLKQAGYEVYYQHWDFVPGSNFMVGMQQAVIHSERTVLVLSDAALKSEFVTAEWTAAMSADPTGVRRKLIPVRVKPVTLPLGLLGQVVYVDLVDLSPIDARSSLLGALDKRREPSSTAAFPELYPDKKSTTQLSASLRKWVDGLAKAPEATAIERSRVTQDLATLSVRYFNMLLEALDVPSGAVPPMPAAPAARIGAFVEWAESKSVSLTAISKLVEELPEIVAMSVPLDQHVPDRLALAAIDSCDGDLAELDQLGRAYVEVKQWPKAFLTYRTLMDLAAELDTRCYARASKRLGLIFGESKEWTNADQHWDVSDRVYETLKDDKVAVKESAELEELKTELLARSPRPEAAG